MTTRILFIGNSYTYCNDLPAMVQSLAQSADRDVEASQVTSGGKTLEWHWYNPGTLDALARSDWDFVVLQEQSTRPVEEPEAMLSAAKRLQARAGSAKVVLYHTWARQNIPEMQEGLNDSYFRVARELSCLVAPAGLAWQKALAENPDWVLHTEDRSHPNTIGTYLTACVFYATLFQTTPAGLTNVMKKEADVSLVIDAEKAGQLQAIAWETVEGFAL